MRHAFRQRQLAASCRWRTGYDNRLRSELAVAIGPRECLDAVTKAAVSRSASPPKSVP
jgi:hypothetical protein